MNNTTDNGTLEADMDFKMSMKKASDILTPCTLIIIMLAMGADIQFRQILSHLKVPLGVIVGMLCQFALMPLIGFSLSQALGLKGPGVLGILLISCCPGGALSNVFTYYIDGDIALSVTMTSISTLLGLGFMPFNFWMYGNWVKTDNLVIPFKDMAISLAFVTIPAAVGILLKWKCPKFSNYVTKIGSVFGLLMVLLCIILYNIAYPNMLRNAPWKYYVAVITMPSVGFVVGYTLALIFRRSTAVCKTIAVESSIQNVAIAFSVLALTPFTYEEQGQVSLFPMLYGIFMTLMGLSLACLFQMFKRFCLTQTIGKKKNNKFSEYDMK